MIAINDTDYVPDTFTESDDITRLSMDFGKPYKTFQMIELTENAENNANAPWYEYLNLTLPQEAHPATSHPVVTRPYSPISERHIPTAIEVCTVSREPPT
jgi:hypothetical protein